MKQMKTFFVWLSILVLILSWAGGKKTEKKEKVLRAGEQFQLAFGAAEWGNLEEAAKEYNEVLKLDPKHVKAHLNLGVVYGKQGKWKKETSAYKKVIDLDPNYAEAYFNQATMEKWLNSPDLDVRWIVRENLKKNHLTVMDAMWMQQALEQLAR